jgi:peptide/nickel transport system permease protein
MVTGISALFLGVPPFVVGLVLVLVFAVNLGWLPATGYVPLSEGFTEWLPPLILPGIALALPLAAEITRQVRAALVDVLEQDYIRTQRAKGLPERTVVMKHAFKNALPPVITVIGLQTARLLSATIIVEAVFGIGGLGQLTFTAVTQHDFPLIQGIAFVSALVVILASLLTDIATTALSPRLRSAAT